MSCFIFFSRTIFPIILDADIFLLCSNEGAVGGLVHVPKLLVDIPVIKIDIPVRLGYNKVLSPDCELLFIGLRLSLFTIQQRNNAFGVSATQLTVLTSAFQRY